METIKIQINHKEPLTVNKLATILYDEIGEEYDLSLEEIEDYFIFLSSTILPNETFITVLEFNIPQLVTRETSLKNIVFSFLQSIENIDGIVSITKVNDTILQEIQEDIKTSNEYESKVKAIEKAKKIEISKYSGDKKNEEFKEWKKELSEKYTNQINNLKDDLEEIYIKEKQSKLKDYSIFMAIAEDIGFDATGRATGNNELEVIEKELTRFINHIIETE